MELFLEQLINGIVTGSTYAVVALGYTLIFGVLEILNLAHGEIFMVGAFIGLLLVTTMKLPFFVALLAAMVGAALLGWLVELVALRPLRRRPVHHTAPLMSTIGVSLILSTGAQIAFGAQQHQFAFADPARYSLGSLEITSTSLTIFTVAVVLMVGLTFILQRTRLGRAMRTVAENPQVAQLLGVNTNFVIVMTMMLASGLGGAAGVLVGWQFDAVYPYMGLEYGLKGLIALIVGGLGSVPGAMTAGLLLGVVETMAVGYIASSYRDAVAFGILILVLLMRPHGLFGQAAGRKG